MTSPHTASADPRDALLQRHTPAVMVPRYGHLAPLETSGHRYLVAQDGLWLEVRRPWLRLRWPLAETPPEHPLPFGSVPEEDRFWLGWRARALDDIAGEFIEYARGWLPDECAAWGVWKEDTHTLNLLRLDPTQASPARVEFERPALLHGWHMAVDLHSHGTMPACFSATDDADDAGDVKIAIVVGDLHKPEPSLAVRLCAHGLLLELKPS